MHVYSSVDFKICKCDFDQIPEELKLIPNWAVWSREFTQADAVKATKVPYDPKLVCDWRIPPGEKKASTNKPETWAEFNLAKSVVQRAKDIDGVGFVLCPPYSGIDIDNCIVDGELNQFAKDIVAQFDSYTEISPSGVGLRIFVKGELPENFNNRDKKIEGYTTGRYLTLTGRRISEIRIINNCQSSLDSLYAQFGKKSIETPKSTLVNPPMPQDDARILELALQAANKAKFQSLWAGDWNGYPSQSEADIALLCILVFYTRDIDQLDRLFRQSGLMRDKWDKRIKDSTYGMRGIDFALNKVTESYTGGGMIVDDCGINELCKSVEIEPIAPQEPIQEPVKEPIQEPVKEPKHKLSLVGWNFVRQHLKDESTALIKDFVYLGEVSCIHSLPWAGKSALLAKAFADVAMGRDWLDLPTSKPRKIVYINSDFTSYKRMAKRISNYLYSEDEHNAFEELFHTTKLEDLDLPLGIEKIIDIYAQFQMRDIWLVLDTFRTSFLDGETGKENDSSVVSYLRPLRKLAARWNWAITIVDHNNKQADDIAGSTSKQAQFDGMANYQRQYRTQPTGSLFINHRDGEYHNYKITMMGEALTYLDCAGGGQDETLNTFINFWGEEPKSLKEVMQQHSIWFDESGINFRSWKNKLKQAQEENRIPRLVKAQPWISGQEAKFIRKS